MWIQGLEGDRAADADAARAAAVSASASASTTEQVSSVAALSGRGILSFLEPPTTEAETSAAAALSERYRLLGEEADARAARARWKRQRSERAVAARASLSMLYAKESNAWKVMAAEAAGRGGETAPNRGVDVTISTAAVGDAVGNDGSVGYDKNTEHDDTDGGMAIEVHVGEDAVAQGGLTVPESAPSPPPPAALSPPLRRSSEDTSLGETDVTIADGISKDERPSGHDGAVMTKGQAASTTMERNSRQGDRHRDDTKFSPITIVQEPGGKSTGVSAALGKRAGETLLDRTPPDDPLLNFSQVKIVQELGRKSDGVSRALGADADDGGDTRVPSDHGADVGTTQELRDKASSVSRVPSSASPHVAGVVDVAIQGLGRLGYAILGETEGRDNLESRSRESQASDNDFASVLRAMETTGRGEDGVCSHSGESFQDGQPSGRSSVDVAQTASEARVEAEGSSDGGEPEAAVGRTIGFALPTIKVRKQSSPLLGDGLCVESQSREPYVRWNYFCYVV